MREIKFRGQTESKEWVHGYYYSYIRDDNGKREHCILQDIGSLTQDFKINYVDPATVGQYTGLKDSKRTEEYPEGQEIYEGDIVVGKWFNEHRELELYVRGKVIFNQGWCSFCIWDEEQKTISELNACGSSSWEVEVIGNIHDNPELLEVQP